MYKLIIFYIAVVPILCFSQQEFHYKSEGRIYNEDNVKFKPHEIRSLFKKMKPF